MSDVAVPSVATATPVSADTVLGVQGGLVKRFAASPPFAQLRAVTGTNLIGFDEDQVYDAGTLGAAMQALATATGATSLGYVASPTNGVVTSDTGTDATLPLATGTNAGLLAPAQFTKLAALSGTNTGDQDLSSYATTAAVASGYQPLDSDLTAFAGLSIAADKLPYGTGSHTLGLADLTAAGRAILDDADAAAQRTTLGLGALATVTPGTGVATALAVNVGTAGAAVVNGGALGTPSSGVATNLTGTASGLTAGTVTTNANLTGDVTSSGNATTIATNAVITATINAKAVTLAKMADIATASFLGRTTASTGVPEVLTATQATALLNVFSTAKGLVPGVASATGQFLRDDGTFQTVSGAGTVTTVSVVSANGMAGTVATATTTPAITLTTTITGLIKGNGAAFSAAAAGTDYVAPSGALGTPSSGTLTSCTGLPVSTGISGLGTSVAAFLATPSSANLAAALTDETGSGAAVFATSPALVTPLLGTPSSGNLSSCTADGTNAVGFKTIPQVSFSANTTTVLTDSGKHFYHPAGDANARTLTIDSNANVAYQVGTALTIINRSANNVTIAITSDTLTLSPGGSTGSRTLAQYGMATAIKVTSTEWMISGTGLT